MKVSHKKAGNKIGVSEAKAKFLSLIRNAENGETIEITKDGKVVAKIIPAEERSFIGFAKIKINGDIINPIGEDDWTYDQDNL